MSARVADEPFDLLALAATATADLRVLVSEAGRRVRERVTEGGRLSPALLDREQHASQAFAWHSTYAAAIAELADYAARLSAEGRFGRPKS